MKRKTKMIASIGPSSADRTTLEKFDELDVSCIRINTAHGNLKQYDELVDMVKKYTSIPILIDIKGPEVRIRTDEKIQVIAGEEKWFGFKKRDGPYFSFNFIDYVKKGDQVYFDNGQIESSVVKKQNGKILLKFNEDAIIMKNKGVNIPNKSLKIPSLSQKDRESIRFAIDKDIAYIALSFVRNKKDVINLKKKLRGTGIGIISKIENREGIENIEDIIDESDGVMIARGDLGVEISEQKIPLLQKHIIKECNKRSKISIVATQMLESMTQNKIPTRAEVSDVANAILDGADSVMLSGETAAGKYPINTVKVINNVAAEVENDVDSDVDLDRKGTISEEISKSAYTMLERTECKTVVAITKDGYSSSLISRYRLSNHILAVTDNRKTKEKLSLVWGVEPVLVNNLPEKRIVKTTAEQLVKRELISKAEFVVFIAGVNTNYERVSNMIEVHKISELL